jgi:L-serine dehydratase
VDHLDKPGAVLSVAKILAAHEINIASMNMYRQGKHDRAYMIIETDQVIESDVLMALRKLDDMYTIYIPQLY